MRMGTPKALLPWGNATVLERIVDVLSAADPDVTLVGDRNPSTDNPDAGWSVPPGLASLPWLPDVPETTGPVAGIASALRADPRATWLITACDLPAISGEAVAWLLEVARETWSGVVERPENAVDAILPRIVTERVEPLFAIYAPSALPPIERLIGTGQRSLQRLVDVACVATPTVPVPLQSAWTNVNTQVEYERLRAQLGV